MTDSFSSWVEGADSTGFGLTHLPYGAFQAADGTRLCVRIGDWLLDLNGCVENGLLSTLTPATVDACGAETLNSLLTLGDPSWAALRARLVELLKDGCPEEGQAILRNLLHPVAEATLVYPLATRGYIDFYASIDHAWRVGELFRPENPLLPNYKHVPIAYNGRASSLIVSGMDVRRPWGQRKSAGERALPTFAPSAALDYELEMGFVVGRGNAHGEPVAISRAGSHLFGVALLNDWSARDVQAWEYQPLGPFLGKSFATSVSPWITPLAALEPYRAGVRHRDSGDPAVLSYLDDAADQSSGAFEVIVEAFLSTEQSRVAGGAPMLVSQGNLRDLFWSPAQMLTHAASNGCPLEAGDLLGSGTLSGAELSSAGCLMELTGNGAKPFALPNGEWRAWLQDGDEVTLRARCEREGLPLLALGECVGRIVAAHVDGLRR